MGKTTAFAEAEKHVFFYRTNTGKNAQTEVTSIRGLLFGQQRGTPAVAFENSLSSEL